MLNRQIEGIDKTGEREDGCDEVEPRASLWLGLGRTIDGFVGIGYGHSGALTVSAG
jgi:hypothetical protein